MDIQSIFSNGLTNKAYQTATKQRSAKQRTNKEWLNSNKEKVEEMRTSKEDILNNIIRNNQSKINGKSYFFRLLGLKNKTLNINIEGSTTAVLPCDTYEDALSAYESVITHYETDEVFQGDINTQLQKQGAVIVALGGV